MNPLLDRLLPRRMGRSFRWLVASSWSTNLGDGIALAAGPLLVALPAGAVADRLDRRRLVIAADLARTLVLLTVVASLVTDHVSILWVLVVLLLLGTAEVFADVTSGTLLPMLVEPRDLGVGNARIVAGFTVGNQLLGPPLGAALFAAGAFWPFAAQMVTLGFGALLLGRIALPAPVEPPPAESIRRQIVTGVRWLAAHPPLRRLAVVMFAFNVTFGAAWSVLVLYALERVGLGAVGFGLLTTAAAVGGLLGTAGYGWLERRFALSTLMRACLLTEVLTHLALALTTDGLVALATMVVFGAYTTVWATLASSVRQKAVPRHLQGRVNSVYLLALFGGLVIGQALGGPIAAAGGIVAPYWFAFAGAALTLVVIWRRLSDIAQVAE